MAERGTLLWWRDALLAWGGTAIILIGAVLALRTSLFADVSVGGRILALTASAAVAIAWGCWFVVRIVRRTDEFHLESSKFAWHWGGLGGVAVSGVAYVFVMAGGLHWIDPAIPAGRQLATAFAGGYGLVIGAQLIGFLIVRAWWSATRR